jgi:hypothetical protein
LTAKRIPAPKPRPTGRPTLRSPEVEKAILASLLNGNTREDSSLAAGVSPSALRLWCHEDVALAAAVEKAEAEARQKMVGVVVKAATDGTWTAAMTFLERRDPEHWARRERIDVLMDIRKAIEQLSDDPAEVEAAVAEAQRLVGRR